MAADFDARKATACTAQSWREKKIERKKSLKLKNLKNWKNSR